MSYHFGCCEMLLFISFKQEPPSQLQPLNIYLFFFFFWCFEGREIKISSQKPGNGFSISFLKPFSQMPCGYPQLQLFVLHSPDKDQAGLFMPALRSACGCSFLTLQGVIWVAVEPSCAACGGPELNAVLNNGIC